MEANSEMPEDKTSDANMMESTNEDTTNGTSNGVSVMEGTADSAKADAPDVPTAADSILTEDLLRQRGQRPSAMSSNCVPQFQFSVHEGGENNGQGDGARYQLKHSSGDLHSRLKTRKLLGVGETDDGDVHRSKLSQILGHSDQLYIRLPGGLRIWQVVLAVVFSVMSAWALLFPTHYFVTMFELDGSTQTFPIRLYATALISIAVMYWSTVQAADRDVIRLVLLSSVVFFTLQTIVTAVAQLTTKDSFSRWSLNLLGLHILCALIGYYFYWSVSSQRSCSLKRTASNKELADKDQ